MADDETQVQTDTTQSTPPPEPAAPTWDNVSASPDPPPAPLETTEAATPPEPEAQPAAEAAPAREGESQPPPPESTPPDEYKAEADDPPEIAALTTPAAKRWAKRQFKEAEISRRYLSPEEPIKGFGDDLYQRSQSRYWEHVDDIMDTHGDEIVKRLLGVPTVAEAKSRLQSQPAPPSAPSTTQSPPTTLTEAELANLSDAQVVERFEAATKAARDEAEQRLRTEFDEKFNSLKTQFDDVSGKFKTQEQSARERQVIALESELKTNVWKVVQDGVRESGLEPKMDDPPEMASLKQAALKLINTQFEPVFDSDEDNVKVVDRVREFARRLERDNVFREEDNLKVRARSTFEKVKQSPEVKTILDRINVLVEQSRAKPKANDPAPPVAGAAAGMTIKPPTTWDEAISQAKSSAV